MSMLAKRSSCGDGAIRRVARATRSRRASVPRPSCRVHRRNASWTSKVDASRMGARPPAPREVGPVREEEGRRGDGDRWVGPPSRGPSRRPRPAVLRWLWPRPPRRPRRAGRRPVGFNRERAGGAGTSTETRSRCVKGGASTVTETVTGARAGRCPEGPRPNARCWCGPEPRP